LREFAVTPCRLPDIHKGDTPHAHHIGGTAMSITHPAKPGTDELRHLVALTRAAKDLADHVAQFQSFAGWSERLLWVSVEQLRDKLETLWQLGPGSAHPDLTSIEREAVTDADARLAAALAASVRANVARLPAGAAALRELTGPEQLEGAGEGEGTAEGATPLSAQLRHIMLGVATRLEEAALATWWC
jgi:hypothetical protein